MYLIFLILTFPNSAMIDLAKEEEDVSLMNSEGGNGDSELKGQFLEMIQ